MKKYPSYTWLNHEGLAFCDIEYIEDTASSASEIIMNLILNTELQCDSSIASTLYLGLTSDSNRFLYEGHNFVGWSKKKNGSCSQKTLKRLSKINPQCPLQNYNFVG